MRAFCHHIPVANICTMMYNALHSLLATHINEGGIDVV